MEQARKLRQQRIRRGRRVRAKIVGDAGRPRLAVFRSNRGFTAQLIDDERGHTLLAVSSREVKGEKGTSKTALAAHLGELLAKRAREAGITKAVFDRRSYAFHGRVSAFAEAVRKSGLVL